MQKCIALLKGINISGKKSLRWLLKRVDEELKLIDKVLYFHYPNGAGRSKVSNNLVEKKLEVRVTTKNWPTTTKLLDLVK